MATHPAATCWSAAPTRASLTIATENDIIVNGDIKHADTDDVMLGLIADGFVRVRHDATYKPRRRRATTRAARSIARSTPPSSR